jgi:hypothetical protein
MYQPVKTVLQVKTVRAVLPVKTAKPELMGWTELPALQELLDQLVPLVSQDPQEPPELPVQQVKKGTPVLPAPQEHKDRQALALTFST